jgi:hypothetical protein
VCTLKVVSQKLNPPSRNSSRSEQTVSIIVHMLLKYLLFRHKLVAQLDPNNSGVLIAYLDSSNREGLGSEELTRRLAQEKDSCIIM